MTQKCVSATLDWFVVIDDRFLHKNRLLPMIPTKCRYIGLQVESRCEEYLNIAKVIDSFDFILSLIKTRKPTNWWGSAKRDVTNPTATVVYNTCYHLFRKCSYMTVHRLA